LGTPYPTAAIEAEIAEEVEALRAVLGSG